MAGNNKADLEAAFRKAVGDFNSVTPANYVGGLQSDLDPHVKMKRIDDPSKYYDEDQTTNGVPQVSNYFLNGNGSRDHATFTPDEPPEFQIVGSTGFASGKGTFADKPGSPNRYIAYSFAFAFSNAGGGSWKAILLWGRDKKDI